MAPSEMQTSLAASRTEWNGTYGETVSYTPAGGSAASITVCWVDLSDVFQEFGSDLDRNKRARMRCNPADVPTWARGDRVTRGGFAYEVQSEFARNAAYVILELQRVTTVEKHGEAGAVARAVP